MNIHALGEFGLIERIKQRVTTDGSVIQGIGDDCAVIRLNKDNYVLYTTDMLVEGVDFTSKDDSVLVGKKALAVSISDIAACAGIPQYALVALGLPKKTRVSVIDRLYKGINAVARQFGVNIVGGDISTAPRLTIAVSMLGRVEKKNLTLRSGAKVGDIIFSTGAFGGSIAGKHLSFTPRVAEARMLVRNFSVHAMIDVSDGLVQDLSHILRASKVGAVLYEDLIPVSPQAKGLRDALGSGEDFELLFTVPRTVARRLREGPNAFFAIGEVVNRKYGLTLLDRRGSLRQLSVRGYSHF